jgi:hypothetical protein
MKTALITTTINIPSVLALYRRFDPSASVRFFVAIDSKTPHAVYDFCNNLGNVQVIAGTDYKCDQIIGWNSIQRRNLALLEALKWGADIIVSVDDDNIPLDPNYFVAFERLFDSGRVKLRPGGGFIALPYEFSGLKVSSPLGWFDVGTLLEPPATHRGFPHDITSLNRFTHAIDAKIGVAAGMVLGDPDTSSVERISKRPDVHGVSEILKAGIVVDPTTRTVFNSQNTAFIRELAPAMMMLPGVGRYDDIFASLLCQRVMRDRGLHVYFGRPFVYQQRNQHNLVNDLKQELFGMENIVRFAEYLDSFECFSATTVLANVHDIFVEMKSLDWMPAIVSECGLAWCEDCEKVMG